MRISIVTINYNGSENTIELLRSLENQTDKEFRTIIIDNASEETDFAHLQKVIHIPTSQVGYPQIVRNAKNLGFSGGNNVGIRHALETGSNWVVLLNNDTWAERDFIEHLKTILSTGEGVIGIPLVEGDRMVYYGQIHWLKPTLIHIPTSQVGYPQVYAIGAAVAIHKKVFDKIGLFDEKYFLYFEDADFSLRAKKAGFEISLANALSVHHHVSSSAKKLGSPALLYYHYRNALYFNLKNGPWYIKLAVWPWGWFIIIKQLVKLVLKINTVQSKAILKGVVDFYFNKMGKINK